MTYGGNDYQATYDGGGDRVTSLLGGVTTTYHMGAGLLQSTTSAGGSTVYTPGISQRKNGVDSYFHDDWIGSTRFLTDSTGNGVPAAYRFDAYGIQSAGSAPGATTVRFAGGHGYEDDGPNGTMLLGARYYAPGLGRFLSPDPIGHAGGLNLYGYVGNDPVNKVDPSGLQDPGTDALANAYFNRAPEDTAKDWGHFVNGLDWLWNEGRWRISFTEFGNPGPGLDPLTLRLRDFEGGVTDAIANFRFGKGGVPQYDAQFTEPQLPGRVVFRHGGVRFVHNYRGSCGDHAPAHVHVIGGGEDAKIGANGKPIKGSRSDTLSPAQKAAWNEGKKKIRADVNAIRRWLTWKYKWSQGKALPKGPRKIPRIPLR